MVRTNDSGTATARPRDTRLRAASIAAVLVIVGAGVLTATGVARAATQIELGTAGSFAVLAGSAITNTGPTTITGDVGLHPGSAVSGFDSVTLHGDLHEADAVASQAKDDLVLAYDSAVGQGPATSVATELGGQLLPGGVYDSADGTFGITGTLTLDAQGTPSTVWIFQTDSTLITASNSSVTLVNGADACNVFWQVGSSATLGTGTTFAGNILAQTSITLNTSATIRGRALASNGAVTADTNTITRADCPPTPAPSSPSPDASPGPDASPSPDASPGPDASPVTDPSPTPNPLTSPSDVAAPIDSPTGTTTGTDTPAAPEASPSPTPPSSGTPQVPDVPTGSVAAGDGSTATTVAGDRRAGLLALPAVIGLVLFAAWRRRTT